MGEEDSYTAKFLKKYQFGFIIPINNLNKGKIILKNILNDLINNKISSNIEKDLLNKFSWNKKAKKLINIIIKKHI